MLIYYLFNYSYCMVIHESVLISKHIALKEFPVKTLLQDLARKGPFFLHPCKILQDSVGSCGVLQESCRILARNSCKIPARFLQNPTRSRKIQQDLARSCKIMQGCKKKGPFLARSCKSVFTGLIFCDIVIIFGGAYHYHCATCC